MANVWFTSDTHFGHLNLLVLRNEIHSTNYQDVSTLDTQLVDNYNSVIRKRDSVYHLGDVCMKQFNSINKLYLSRLLGDWKLILGNHDKTNVYEYLKFFKSVHGSRNRNGFIMSHLPVHPQELQYRQSYNVHGHIHHIARNLPLDRYFNVNVDVNNLMPVHLDDILAQFNIRHGE